MISSVTNLNWRGLLKYKKKKKNSVYSQQYTLVPHNFSCISFRSTHKITPVLIENVLRKYEYTRTVSRGGGGGGLKIQYSATLRTTFENILDLKGTVP